jgi:anti-sigma regulatory factor (Ser/Thr protein kinase)
MTSDGPLRFKPDAGALRSIRRGSREMAERLGAPEAMCDIVALVVDELVNNAIEHGASYRRLGADLSVGVAMDRGRVCVEFIDPEMPDQHVQGLAAALAAAGNGMPSLESERGRGLFLIAIYMEEVRVAIAPGGGLQLIGRLAPG